MLGRDGAAFEAVKAGDMDALAMIALKARGGPMSEDALGIRNSAGQTPLHFAAEMGNIDAIKWMLQCEAEARGPVGRGLLFAIDAQGQTPAQTAQQHGQILASRMLKKAEKKGLRTQRTHRSGYSPSPTQPGLTSRSSSRFLSPSPGGLLAPLPSPSRVPTAEIRPFAGRVSAAGRRSPSKLPQLSLDDRRSLSPPPSNYGNSSRQLLDVSQLQGLAGSRTL